MALSPRVVVASQSFNMNVSYLKQSLDGLSEEEWLKRPNDTTNNILWIVGHITWARTMLLARLGQNWTTAWMKDFGRGEKCGALAEGLSPQEVWSAWDETCTRLDAALESATEELLDSPASRPGPPSADGLMSGVVNFMAVHETYHVGQVAFLRCWLGKPGIMG